MPESGRELIARWWNEAWTEGLWAASWQKALEGLTPEQAAWRPPGDAGKRHSIWQQVLHMVFWREGWLRRAATGQKLTDQEKATGNFPEITDVSVAAWEATLGRFRASQERTLEALKDPDPKNDPLIYFLPHDCYHMGQIMYLRAMQGLPPIE